MPGRSDAVRRDAIDIARVFCIGGIVYTHAWTGVDAKDIAHQPYGWHVALYWIMVETLGRNAVPLLSVISGWLVIGSLNTRGARSLIKNKFATLLAPMAAWNLITILAIGIAVLTIDYKTSFEPVGLQLVDHVFNLTTAETFNFQNAFLRDTFVCMVMAPLLIRLPAWMLWGLLSAVAAWSVAQWELYVILRPQILLFFLIGILARRHDFDGLVSKMPVHPLIASMAFSGVTRAWMSMQGPAYAAAHPYLVAACDNMLRLVAAAVFWRLALYLARTPFARAFKTVAPYTIMLFCAHVLILEALVPVAVRVFGRFGDPLWPVYFLIQPFVVLACTLVIGVTLNRHAPALARLLSGGRVKQERRPVEAPSSSLAA